MAFFVSPSACLLSAVRWFRTQINEQRLSHYIMPSNSLQVSCLILAVLPRSKAKEDMPYGWSRFFTISGFHSLLHPARSSFSRSRLLFRKIARALVVVYSVYLLVLLYRCKMHSQLNRKVSGNFHPSSSSPRPKRSAEWRLRYLESAFRWRTLSFHSSGKRVEGTEFGVESSNQQGGETYSNHFPREAKVID